MSPKVLILVLVAPTVALIALVVISALSGRYFRRRCPACLRRGLKSVSVVRTFTETRGESSPEYWSYLVCERCGERFKLHNGLLTGVPDDERDEATRFG